MRFIILILFSTISYTLQAQDTIHMRGRKPFITKVLEVDENTITILKDSVDNITEVIKLAEIKVIKYNGGYVERHFVDSISNYQDYVTLRDEGVVRCFVVEVSENHIHIEQHNVDTFRIISLDSIAFIKYASGFNEKYNELLVKDKPKLANEETGLANAHQAGRAKPPTSTPTSVPVAAPVAVTKLPSREVIAQNAAKPDDRKSKPTKEEKPPKDGKQLEAVTVVANRSNDPFKIGIGVITDTTNGLNRSFALQALLKNNPIERNDTVLQPTIKDYPYRTRYFVTGTFSNGRCNLKFYKNGKKTAVVQGSDWKDVYAKLTLLLKEDGYEAANRRFKDVFEGSHLAVPFGRVSEGLPGRMEHRVPYVLRSDSLLGKQIRMTFVRNRGDEALAENMVRNIYGAYKNSNETELYFFRGEDVPESVRKVARPLIFPRHYSLEPSLNYLACGNQFLQEKDLESATVSYFAALNSSDQLITSPAEKSIVRGRIFDALASLSLQFPKPRTHCAAIYKLCADLNYSFVNSGKCRQKRNEYYTQIGKIEKVLEEAETKARQIRATRTKGLLAGLAVMAGGFAAETSVGAEDMLTKSLEILESTSDATSNASTALDNIYKGIEQKINSSSFVVEGSEIDGESLDLLATREIWLFLTQHEQESKDLILRFASNKNHLRKLTEEYLKAGGGEDKQQLANQFFTQMSKIYAFSVAAEARGIDLNENVLKKF